MKRLLPFLKPIALLAAIAVVCFAADVLAVGGGPFGCPRDIQCPMVYDPVTCDNGVTYSNACVAFAACATGCSEGGAGS